MPKRHAPTPDISHVFDPVRPAVELTPDRDAYIARTMTRRWRIDGRVPPAQRIPEAEIAALQARLLAAFPPEGRARRRWLRVALPESADSV